jgi:tripartite-type tricarboxylate transporter receptor subunit TctC
MTTRRTFLKSMAGASLIAVAPRAASANDWPQKPVRIFCPFAPGGNTDGIARQIAQHLSEKFGQQFFVENRTGAGGSLAAEATAKADPDGYTLMVSALAQLAIFPAMRPSGYNPLTDFTPISNIASNPFLLVTNPKFEPKTLQEFVSYVKERPGKIVYASGGPGSVGHLTMVLFLQRAGLEMIHAPYKGGAPAMADVLAGHVPVYFGNLSEGLPHAGNLKFLAVSGANRVSKLPNVPTVAESGYPGFKTETWNGLIGPAKLPQAIVDTLANEVRVALKDKKVLERLDSYGVDPIGSTPAEFKATIEADVAQWSKAVASADVKL